MLNSMSGFRRTATMLGVLLALAAAARAQTSFLEFESGPVRPLALTPDRSKLLVCNIPDNRLEIFAVSANGLTLVGSVPVGMEPVAVAARSNTEAWVVNHLSDSVSVVDLASTPPRVARTLVVGDEPRDIVFAGAGGNRAFITTAHRGQQRTDASISSVTGAGDPQLTTPSTGRADVWVFDATNLGSAFGGTPIRILTFFADTPRALATDAGGTNVYVAAFHSGNQTTPVAEPTVPNSFVTTCSAGPGSPGNGIPGPGDNAAHAAAPPTGIIVKRLGANWVDSLGCTWNAAVQFQLPDRDVFKINASDFSVGTTFTGVGTVLFNMVVNPVSGRVYVTNTESPNLTPFEGPGSYAATVLGSPTKVTV